MFKRKQKHKRRDGLPVDITVYATAIIYLVIAIGGIVAFFLFSSQTIR
jgi:hypothetical protein